MPTKFTPPDKFVIIPGGTWHGIYSYIATATKRKGWDCADALLATPTRSNAEAMEALLKVMVQEGAIHPKYQTDAIELLTKIESERNGNL